MAWFDTQEAPRPDTYNLDILATVACFELERLKRLASKDIDNNNNKRTVSVADHHITATTTIPKQKRSKRPRAAVKIPAFKKLKAEVAAEPIFSSVASDLALTLIKTKKKKKAATVRSNPVSGPPPLREKLKAEEAAEPIFSSVVSDLALTLIKTEKKKKKKKKAAPVRSNPVSGPPPLREAPAGLKQMVAGLNGSEAILVAEKPLTDSDVKRNLGRLQIPESQMNQFLSDGENNYLKIKVGSKMNGIGASLHQSAGGELWGCSGVKVKRWEMVKSNGSAPAIMCVLTTGWNDVVARNKLKAGDMVQVWSFRVNQKLHLALLLL